MERRVNSKGRKMWGQWKAFFFFFSSKGDYYNLFAHVLSGSKPPVLIRENGDSCCAKVVKQVRGAGSTA